jgi:hypothetical protein
MIPSEDARKTHRGIRRYFAIQGETVELPETPTEEEPEEEPEDDEEEELDYELMEEGHEIVEDDDIENHD